MMWIYLAAGLLGVNKGLRGIVSFLWFRSLTCIKALDNLSALL